MSVLVQGSDEWLRLRAGKVTASRLVDLLARTKTGPAASRDNYKAELVIEILSGLPTEKFTSTAMQHGTETEPFARQAYASRVFDEVTEIGFVQHPTIERAGASPDGLVGDEGLIEIKCPNSFTHMQTLLSDKVPEKYIPQMQWQMACTGRLWCDFVSFDDRVPEPMQLFVQRVERDDLYIASCEESVRRFLEEVEETVKQLKEKFNV